MSGIAGIIHFDGRPVEPGQVEAMTAAMHYRGPDGIHHWRRGNVALGQCMLRTTPESLEETQPLTNEDESLVLVMDGRVDNWEELRRELLGQGRSAAALGPMPNWCCGPMKSGARIARIGSSVSACSSFGMHGSSACSARGMPRAHGISTTMQATGWFAFASEIKGLLALERIEPPPE